jgi:hypothetical protein
MYFISGQRIFGGEGLVSLLQFGTAQRPLLFKKVDYRLLKRRLVFRCGGECGWYYFEKALGLFF